MKNSLSAAVLFLLCLSARGAWAATHLLMFEQEGCHYCEQWMREIGDRYPLTDEGKQAPLRRVFLDKGFPADLPPTLAKIAITPTFVLIRDGQEVDRLVGYAGDNFFWAQLQEMLSKLPNHLTVAEK